LQEKQGTFNDVVHDFGMYAVNIQFDQDELSDSDDKDYQPPLQEEATNVLKILTQRKRQDIYEDLLRSSTNGILQRNNTTLVADKHDVHVHTVQRIWQRAKNCLTQELLGTRHTSRCQF
jgi:hypothetical protein